MLSKEEKLRYGEILRQQMKEKEERKRIEDLSKRQAPIPKTISAPAIVPDPAIYLSQPSPDPKEQLQKQLEKQDYNPFGKAGGGAPNRRQPQTVTANDPNYSQLAQQSGEYGGLPMEQRYPSQQLYDPRQAYRPQFAEQPRMQEPQRQYQDYPPAVSPQSYQRKQPDPVRYEPSLYEQPQRYEPPPQPQRFQPPPQRYQPPPQPAQRFEPPPPISVPAYELPPDSEQLQQMYRRGGRNLLKLQNETANEHIVKQRQKLEMQAFLRQQMEEAERRKQEEKDRLKREEIEEERRNREYIQLQNFKLKEEERRKQEEKQRIVDENSRNLAKRKELQQQAKEKLQRQDRQRQEAANRRQAPILQRQPRHQPRHEPSPLPLPLPRHESDSSSLTSSSATITHQNFNTDISKQFFKQQREATRPPDRKLELVTAEIERMRAEISNQGDMFQQELHRIKLQAELAQQEKMKAQLEIERLKLELERKNQEAELRLMQAVKRNDPYQQSAKFNGYNYDQQPERLQPPTNYHNHSNHTPQPYQSNNDQNNYEANNSFQSPPSQPPPQNRPMPKQTRVPEYQPTQKSYSAKGKLQDLDYHPKLEESGVATLQADSKKIPINLPANRQLTLSKIQHYGKDNSYYQQEPQRHLPKPYPIPEEDEYERPRAKSRQNGEDRPRVNSRQNEDELDRFVQGRGQNKWEMSTVKDDFNKEIEELLKQKDYRPQGSQMSQAGRQILSRGGLPYEGPNLNSLNSNKQSLVSNGTVDIDKIHDRNEARLRQLRALGVETINTTNDEDLNRLDAVLKNYR